jgi:hypothetical protein
MQAGGLAVAGESGVDPFEKGVVTRQSFKRPVQFAPVAESRSTDWPPGKPQLSDVRDPNQAIGFAEGERPKKQGVNQAEDGGIHPDPERQGKRGHNGETWTLQQLAKSEPDVASHRALDMPTTASSRDFICVAYDLFNSPTCIPFEPRIDPEREIFPLLEGQIESATREVLIPNVMLNLSFGLGRLRLALAYE